MKKIMLFFLILCFTCFSVSAYATEENAIKKIETLEKYGIIQGDHNGDLRLNDYITRSEVATIACRLLCLNIIEEKSSFMDVEEDFWGKDYINTAHKNDIIHGYEDMMFKPNQNITYSETIKIIISCLGYAPFAENSGSYPSGYITVAKDFSLITEDAYDPQAFIKREKVFDIIYSSLDIPIAIEEDYGEKKILIMDGTYDDTPLTTLRMRHVATIEK